jgi:mono/diheme cytochrome c family protein
MVTFPCRAAAGLLVATIATIAPTLADQVVTNPTAEQAATSALDGKVLFASTCGFCHAKGGREAGKGPKLAGSARSDEFLIDRIKRGVPGKMPAFGTAFTDEQIQQILAYIRSLEA